MSWDINSKPERLKGQVLLFTFWGEDSPGVRFWCYSNEINLKFMFNLYKWLSLQK